MIIVGNVSKSFKVCEKIKLLKVKSNNITKHSPLDITIIIPSFKIATSRSLADVHACVYLHRRKCCVQLLCTYKVSVFFYILHNEIGKKTACKMLLKY